MERVTRFKDNNDPLYNTVSHREKEKQQSNEPRVIIKTNHSRRKHTRLESRYSRARVCKLRTLKLT